MQCRVFGQFSLTILSMQSGLPNILSTITTLVTFPTFRLRSVALTKNESLRKLIFFILTFKALTKTSGGPITQRRQGQLVCLCVVMVLTW